MQEVEPDAIEATCADCIASDNSKDVAMRDEYFRRIWRAVQLKRAGIPVMELIETLDDALAIQAVESEAESIEYEKRREDAGTPKDDVAADAG